MPVHKTTAVASSLLEPMTCFRHGLGQVYSTTCEFTPVNQSAGPFRKLLANPIIVICQWTYLAW